jgi:Uma2 family endonuclease
MASAMQQVEASHPLTYDDLLATPDDGQRYEIIGGELFVSPSPGIPHQRVALHMAVEIEAFIRRKDLGEVFVAPVDVKLTEHDIVVPDLVFVSRERASIIRDRAIEGAPDLLVEILSPSSKGRDRVRKSALYATSGVREYWIVDPDRSTVETYRLNEGRYQRIAGPEGVVRSEVLAGFEIETARFFAVPDRG